MTYEYHGVLLRKTGNSGKHVSVNLVPGVEGNDLLMALTITHYSDVIMRAMASQITSVSMICSTVCSDADQRKHQSSASLAFVRGIHRWSVNSPHKGPVTRKMFPFDDVIMFIINFIPVNKLQYNFIRSVNSPHKGPVTRNVIMFIFNFIPVNTLQHNFIRKEKL